MSAFDATDEAAFTSDERVLRAAVAAYLGRYRGQSRLHTGSDLKIYLTWCTDQDLDPLRVGRVDIERYVRWLQEIRYYQPSTVCRPGVQAPPSATQLLAVSAQQIGQVHQAAGGQRDAGNIGQQRSSSGDERLILVDLFVY